MYVCIGLLFLGLAVPLIRRRVPPNAWYGFRVPKTLQNASVWYPVNEYSGKQLYRTGMLLILVAFVSALVPKMPVETYLIINTTVFILDLFRGLLLTFRYMRTF